MGSKADGRFARSNEAAAIADTPAFREGFVCFANARLRGDGLNLSFGISTDLDDACKRHPEFRTIYERWLGLSSDNALPALGDIAWEKLDVVDDLMLVERIAEGVYHYHAYGKNIATAAGFDLKGKTTGELRSRAGQFFVQSYDRALADKLPLYTTNPALHAALVSSWERLLLPFADEHGAPRFVLGYNRPGAFRHELLASILDAASDAIIGLGTAIDEEGRPRMCVVTLNSEAERLIGASDEVIGQPLDDVIAFGDGALMGESYVMAALERPLPPVEWRRESANRDEWYRIEVRPFKHGGVITMTDITSLKETESTLSELAMTDALTGLSNRRRFVEDAKIELKRSQRNRNSIALLMLDIDHFKLVNDRYGHFAGDRVLAGLANRVSAELREPDLLARLGGEEFAILLPETTAVAAIAIANRIRIAIASAPFIADDVSLNVTCSFGISDTINAPDFETLLRQADESLYEAKDAGRNTVRIYNKGAPLAEGHPPAARSA